MKRYLLLLIAAAFSTIVVEAADFCPSPETEVEVPTTTKFLPTRQRINRNIGINNNP